MKQLPPGLYEKIIASADVEVVAALGPRAATRPLNESEASRRLAGALHEFLVRALDAVKGEGEARTSAQLHLCNRLIESLIEEHPKFTNCGDRLTQDLLLLVHERNERGVSAPLDQEDLVRPKIPLSESALFVNGPRERRIGSELPLEIASADAVDFICPFLFWSGYVVIKPAIEALRERGRPFRVLTSTYGLMTQPKVLDELVALGAEVKVSYEQGSNRLHAKAWFFRRESGFSTAFVGSSNLSMAAQVTGLEWNVRLSQIENRATLEEFQAAFENYWSSTEFEPYDPETFRSRTAQATPSDALDHVFELRPFNYQREALERLAAARELHNRHRNLVVAATGTGKTVIAALDYARLTATNPPRPTLLFLAHRKEILTQARSTYRHAVGEGSFGELFVDGERPRRFQHVFASVQSMAHLELEDLPRDHFDVLVIDEIHHASAFNRSYARLLEYYAPKELLGLTATPERADGVSILAWFDGQITAELRLWDAIDRGLLVPFQYFAIHDDTDLRDVAWRGGRYDAQALEGRFDGNAARAHIICRAVQRHVEDPTTMRALGFCAGVSHAQYMTRAFQRAGIPAACVTGNTSSEERATALAQLSAGSLNAIFCVDVFNEGVDLPSVDTVLFLRPTESAPLFTQQLGRGLRRAANKRCLTVLDFVGRAHQSFRYDLRFRALTGQGRRTLASQVAEDFPYLPAGCSIALDELSKEIVLENLKSGIANTKASLLAELRSLGPQATLKSFLRETELALEDVYRVGRTFTELRRAAGFDASLPGPQEAKLAKAIGRLIHIDDRLRIDAWQDLLADPHADRRSVRSMPGPTTPAHSTTSDRKQRRVSGAHSTLFQSLKRMLATAIHGPEAFLDPDQAIADLRAHASLCEEFRTLLALRDETLDHEVLPFRAHANVPLAIHARYTLTEIMAAFGAQTQKGHLYEPREGVFFHEPTRCNLLFVTLNKDEDDYSPTTLYRDYALSLTRFHWQSQSRTRPSDKKGQRHLAHESEGITPLMFVRSTKLDERRMTVPYTFLGPARLVAATGERPMNVEWELEVAMPPEVYNDAAVAAG